MTKTLPAAASAGPRWDAADYHRNSSQQQKWARELITRLALTGTEHILDIGCGDGKITRELAALVPGGRVLGIDASAEMIAFARQSFAPDAHPHLSFARVDARELDFRGAFDVVFSNAALHWIIDHRPVLAGIARALKPRGRILLQMGGKRCAHQVIAVVEKLIQEPRWQSYYQSFAFPYGFYSPEEYRPWVIEAGLHPIRLELLLKDMVHPGAEGLTGWFRTTWLPYTSRLPEALRPAFMDEVIRRYLASHPLDAFGNAHVEMFRLEVEANR